MTPSRSQRPITALTGALWAILVLVLLSSAAEARTLKFDKLRVRIQPRETTFKTGTNLLTNLWRCTLS